MAYLKTLEEVKNVLDAATEANSIYNVDFKNVKDSLNRLYEKERDVVNNLFLTNKNEEERAKESEVYYALPYGTHTLGGKSFTKVLADAPNTAYTKAIEELVAKYVPFAAQVKALKSVIVKGRKPSNTIPVNVRTLENTGTCAICGRNVKMKDGKIVPHGYHIQFGFQSGNCFGVDFEPIEISNKALIAYVKVLSKHSLNLSDTIAKRKDSDADIVIYKRYGKDTVITKNDEAFEKQRNIVIANLEREKIFTEKTITETNMRIKNWKPGVLPG